MRKSDELESTGANHHVGRQTYPTNQEVAMPVKPGASRKVISANIRELKKGPQYQQTKREHGRAAAHKQAVAIAIDKAKESKK